MRKGYLVSFTYTCNHAIFSVPLGHRQRRTRKNHNCGWMVRYKPASAEALRDAVRDWCTGAGPNRGPMFDWDVSEVASMEGLFGYSNLGRFESRLCKTFNEDIRSAGERMFQIVNVALLTSTSVRPCRPCRAALGTSALSRVSAGCSAVLMHSISHSPGGIPLVAHRSHPCLSPRWPSTSHSPPGI